MNCKFSVPGMYFLFAFLPVGGYCVRICFGKTKRHNREQKRICYIKREDEEEESKEIL